MDGKKEEVGTTNIIPIKNIIVNLFAGERFLKALFASREKILTQARDGKRGYYTFSYPGVGWVQYDHVSIETLFRLASAKSTTDLASVHLSRDNPDKLRLHAIGALLIKNRDRIMKLYNETQRARDNRYKPRVISIVFHNPFKAIVRSDRESISLNGEQLIKLQDIGHRMKFQPFLPYNQKVWLKEPVPQIIPEQKFVEVRDDHIDEEDVEVIINRKDIFFREIKASNPSKISYHYL